MPKPLSLDLSGIRLLFPACRKWAYLASASMGPVPAPVSAAVQECLGSTGGDGAMAYPSCVDAARRARQLLGVLLGCPSEELALTRNTTHGLLLAAECIPWRPGDNVVINELEFPSNVFPWMLASRRHELEVRTVKATEGRIPVDSLAAAMDARTRAIAISWVQYTNGFRADLLALADLCRRSGAYLVVDAVQGFGVLRLSVRDLGPRVLAAGGGHKWLLCPPGIGWFHCPLDLLDELKPAAWGWLSMQHPFEFSHEVRLRDSTARFEEGNFNTLGAHALDAALSLIEGLGVDRIEHHVLMMADRLEEGLRRRGCEVLRATGRERSSIVLFRHPRADAAKLAELLKSAGVAVNKRGDAIRASVHFFNSDDDLARLLDSLPD